MVTYEDWFEGLLTTDDLRDRAAVRGVPCACHGAGCSRDVRLNGASDRGSSSRPCPLLRGTCRLRTRLPQGGLLCGRARAFHPLLSFRDTGGSRPLLGWVRCGDDRSQHGSRIRYAKRSVLVSGITNGGTAVCLSKVSRFSQYLYLFFFWLRDLGVKGCFYISD